MARYETYHTVEIIFPFGGKTSTKVDKETGNRAEATVWEWESYKKADDNAWERLQEKNEKGYHNNQPPKK